MPASSYKSFSENLRSLRYYFGLTQKELAAAFDVSQEAYSKWERGASRPASARLRQIAEYYKFSASDLLHRDSNELLREILDRASPPPPYRKIYDRGRVLV